MHHESIAARSRLHDWEIQPHRHELLFQLLYIEDGSVDAQIDGRTCHLNGPAVIAVPPLVPHGFRFSRRVRGRVLTLLDAHLQQLLAAAPALREQLRQPQATALPLPHQADWARAVDQVCREQDDRGPWRQLGLDAAIVHLLVGLARWLPSAPEAPGGHAGPVPGDRALAHVQAFRELVEQRFRQHPTMQGCADALGITPTQLNRVCRQVLGHPAQAVLHARLVLEAQRELAYTTLSIKQVAFDLGFTDAGYFTRFFERECGETPSRWRQQVLRGQHLSSPPHP